MLNPSSRIRMESSQVGKMAYRFQGLGEAMPDLELVCATALWFESPLLGEFVSATDTVLSERSIARSGPTDYL